MTDMEFISTLSLIASVICVLLLIKAFGYYQLDNFRERMFALREEVFLFALEEGLLESEAYKNFRIILNSLLRYGHRISFSRMLLLFLGKKYFKISPRTTSNPVFEWKQAAARLPVPQREKFQQFDSDAMGLVVRYMALRSVVFWGVVVVGLVCLFVKGQMFMSFSKLKAAIESQMPVNLLEEEALRSTG